MWIVYVYLDLLKVAEWMMFGVPKNTALGTSKSPVYLQTFGVSIRPKFRGR